MSFPELYSGVEAKVCEIIRYFFECYFHQDWRDDYSSSLEVVRAFNLDEPFESRQGLIVALMDLLQQSDLSQETINKLGGNFKPETEGLSVRGWIEQAVEVIQES